LRRVEAVNHETYEKRSRDRFKVREACGRRWFSHDPERLDGEDLLSPDIGCEEARLNFRSVFWSILSFLFLKLFRGVVSRFAMSLDFLVYGFEVGRSCFLLRNRYTFYLSRGFRILAWSLRKRRRGW